MRLDNVNLSLILSVDIFDMFDLLDKIRTKMCKMSGNLSEDVKDRGYVFDFDEYFTSQYDNFKSNLTIGQWFKVINRIAYLNKPQGYPKDICYENIHIVKFNNKKDFFNLMLEKYDTRISHSKRDILFFSELFHNSDILQVLGEYEDNKEIYDMMIRKVYKYLIKCDFIHKGIPNLDYKKVIKYAITTKSICYADYDSSRYIPNRKYDTNYLKELTDEEFLVLHNILYFACPELMTRDNMTSVLEYFNKGEKYRSIILAENNIFNASFLLSSNMKICNTTEYVLNDYSHGFYDQEQKKQYYKINTLLVYEHLIENCCETDIDGKIGINFFTNDDEYLSKMFPISAYNFKENKEFHKEMLNMIYRCWVQRCLYEYQAKDSPYTSKNSGGKTLSHTFYVGSGNFTHCDKLQFIPFIDEEIPLTHNNLQSVSGEQFDFIEYGKTFEISFYKKWGNKHERRKNMIFPVDKAFSLFREEYKEYKCNKKKSHNNLFNNLKYFKKRFMDESSNNLPLLAFHIINYKFLSCLTNKVDKSVAIFFFSKMLENENVNKILFNERIKDEDGYAGKLHAQISKFN